MEEILRSPFTMFALALVLAAASAFVAYLIGWSRGYEEGTQDERNINEIINKKQEQKRTHARS